MILNKIALLHLLTVALLIKLLYASNFQLVTKEPPYPDNLLPHSPVSLVQDLKIYAPSVFKGDVRCLRVS